MAVGRVGVLAWLKSKTIEPLLLIVRRGAEPKELAFSSAMGFTLGLFPICGVTVFLCGLAIALLGHRCHAPSMMLFNFVATPIELSLVIPFLRLGEIISGGPHFPLTADALKLVLTGKASKDVLLSVFHAVLGWSVASPLILPALFLMFLPLFKILVDRFGNLPSSPKKTSNPFSEHKVKVRNF